MTKMHTLAIALFAAFALSACGGDAPPADGHAAEASHGAPRSSSAGLPAGHVEAGEKLANLKMGANNQSCIDCHGPDGNTPNGPDRPKIGGQYADYLEHALMAYRKGDRTNITMVGQATELTDQQIADVSAYFAAAPSQLQDLDGLQ
jgi:cytochrome c553